MKKLVNILLLVTIFFLVVPLASAAPKNLKKHALAKVLVAAGTGIKYAPKAALKTAGKGVSYTIGSVFFAAESGVDVVHLATDVLDKGVAAEGWRND